MYVSYLENPLLEIISAIYPIPPTQRDTGKSEKRKKPKPADHTQIAHFIFD